MNIAQARALRLVQVTRAEEAVLHDVLEKIWNRAPDDLDGYNEASGCLRDRLTRSMSRRIHRADGRMTIHRVMNVRQVDQPLFEVSGYQGSVIRDRIRQLTGLLDMIRQYDAESAASAPDTQRLALRLKAMFEGFSEALRSLPETFPTVPARSLHKDLHQTWVIPPADAPIQQLPSQELRDALGMVHYPHGEANADSLLQSLVHLTLSVEPLTDSLPDPDLRGTTPLGAWLVRPTVCDMPNHRFLQRHRHDDHDPSDSTGRTINIGTDEYEEGFPELILVHGDAARLNWEDVRYLPPPSGNARDLDHTGFFNVIQARFP
jgi:hypothetical protein